jgi:hypothetical protein
MAECGELQYVSVLMVLSVLSYDVRSGAPPRLRGFNEQHLPFRGHQNLAKVTVTVGVEVQTKEWFKLEL